MVNSYLLPADGKDWMPLASISLVLLAGEITENKCCNAKYRLLSCRPDDTGIPA
jgi:hypothetical protein